MYENLWRRGQLPTSPKKTLGDIDPNKSDT